MKEKSEKNKKNRNRFLLLGGVLLCVVAGGFYYYLSSGVEIQTAEVGQGTILKQITETGTVESHFSVTVSGKMGGQILSVPVKEGDLVKKGQLLLIADGSGANDVANFQAQAAGIRAQLKTAKNLADKNKVLYEEGAISYEEYNGTLTAVQQLEAQLEALGYSAASVKDQTGGGRVVAPAAGRITQVYVEEGEFAIAGNPFFEISDLTQLYIKANLIAEDADLVRTGQKVRVKTGDEKIVDENAIVSKVYTKAVDTMSSLGIAQKRVGVEITLSSGAEVRLGSDFDVTITIEKKDNAIFVPEKAVFEWEDSDYVYVVEAGKAKMRKVEIGLEGEDETEILSGVKKGEIVILSPGSDVEDGCRVKEKAKN